MKKGPLTELEIKSAEDFIATNQQLSTVEKLAAYGRVKYKHGRDAGVKKTVRDSIEIGKRAESVFGVTLGGYVKHHEDVGIAVEETLYGWRVMLPDGLFREVNEKDLTAISPSEFVESVRPSKFVTNS